MILDQDKMTASGAVRKVIEDYPVGHEFHGYDLKKAVVRIYPNARAMYVDTLLRTMRKYCHFEYILIDRKKSLYKKIKRYTNECKG